MIVAFIFFIANEIILRFLFCFRSRSAVAMKTMKELAALVLGKNEHFCTFCVFFFSVCHVVCVF